jgi:multiple sugar transport system substrate-binding protein
MRRTGEMRRGLALAMLAVLLLAMPGVAAGRQEAPSGEITFSFWGDPAELAAYRSLSDAYMAAHPGATIRLAHVPRSDEFFARLATGFAAGNPPDVFLLNYRRYGQFASRGALTPVGPLLAGREFDPGAYYPGPLEAFTREGELVCLPQNLSSLVVYYNRDLFAAAGVPLPEPDWTWDEFLSAAQALTKDIDGDGLTDQHGLGVENSLIRFTPFIWQAGGELVDDVDNPSRLTIDTPEARAGIQWFIDLNLVHGVVPTEPEVLARSDEDRFMDGTTAMLLQSRRVVPTLRGIQSFTWDVASLPTGEEAAGILHSDAYCMAAGSANPDLAIDFIAWAGGPDGQAIAAQAGRTVPSLAAVAESPAFLGPREGVASGTPLDRFNAPASARVFLDTIPDIRRVPSISTWPEVEEAFNNTLGRAFYGEIPVDQAIEIAIQRSADAFARAAAEQGE